MWIVYCDVDGVLRDLVGAADRLYRDKFPGNEPVEVPDYDLSKRYPRWGDETWDLLFREEASRVFLRDAEEYAGAIAAINWLHTQDNIEVRVLTKQDGERITLTEQWLGQMGLDESIGIHFVPGGDAGISKGEYLDANFDEPSFQYASIDDSLDELVSCDGKVDLMVCVDRIWNQEDSGCIPIDLRVPNLNQTTVEQLAQFMQEE